MRITQICRFIAFAILLAMPALGAAASHKGETSVGLRGGFTTRNTTATAGLYLSYRFTEHFRVSPKLDYAFPHHNIDAFSFDIDCEMPLSLSAADNINFYPIAGLNYSTYSYHIEKGEDSSAEETSQRRNDFGLSFGAGLEYFATPTLRLAVESKGVIIKRFSGGWFTLSIGYRF